MNEEAEELVKATGMPATGQMQLPDNFMDNLVAECKDQPFWLNFRKAAPLLFCSMMESNPQVKQVRDMSFIEELLKLKSVLQLMSGKIESGDANIDVIEYSMATQSLENKLSVLQAVNTTSEGDNENQMTLNIQGSNKAIQIDLKKLRECVTFLDNQVDEKTQKVEDILTKV